MNWWFEDKLKKWAYYIARNTRNTRPPSGEGLTLGTSLHPIGHSHMQLEPQGNNAQPDVRDKIMEGYEALLPPHNSQNSSVPEIGLPQIAEWMKQAVSRMDALLDEDTRVDIMTSLACEFPAWRIQEFRELYEAASDKSRAVDEILVRMAKDGTTYGPTERQGSAIITIKVPFDAEGFRNAKTPEERRLACCHCTFIKAMKGEISPSFCYCGIGWDRMLWEGILGKRVKVRVLESIVQGDERCKFKMELPQEISF